MAKIRDSIEANIQKMSSLSHTVPKIVQVVNDIGSSARDLVKVIQMDPVLAAKVLKIVNSAFYGLRQEITSLNKAVILVGMNTVKNLALSTAVVNSFAFDEKESGLTSEAFWKYSVGTGVICSLLARQAKLPKAQCDDLFIIGLLHCIGKAFFLQFYPKEYGAMIAKAEEKGMPLIRLEEQVFQITHAEVGAILADKWKLPASVVDGVRNYLEPDQSTILSTMYLSAGVNLIKEAQVGFSGDYYPHLDMDDVVWGKIKVPYSSAINIVHNQLDAELEKAEAFIKGT